jgi:hypothetical protein
MPVGLNELLLRTCFMTDSDVVSYTKFPGSIPGRGATGLRRHCVQTGCEVQPNLLPGGYRGLLPPSSKR